MRRPIFLSILLCSATNGSVHAQTVLDGAYIREHVRTQRPLPYTHLREADVQWHRRVWRVIDLREKINLPLYYPLVPNNGRSSLFDVIKRGLEEGAISAFDPGVLLKDDDFRRPMMRDEVSSVLHGIDSTWTNSLTDPDSNILVVSETDVATEEVLQYKVKEDWQFDKQRGKVDIRIIGIAPMKQVTSDDGEVIGAAPLFWLYFPELRYYLANEEVQISGNVAQRISFEELFAKRRFSSYVTEVSNVYDRSLPEYQIGVEALLSGQRIKHDLFSHEHDLWNW